MSWIVQHLIRNSEKIRAIADTESDEFNNLLVVEKMVSTLHRSGLLSDIDLLIIETVSDGKPFTNMEGVLGRDRITISRTFTQICDRLSYFLGGYFTDEGFVENLRTSYELTNEDVDLIRKYMSGKFKHRLIRKKFE